MSEKEKLYSKLFILTAIFSITTPIFLILSFSFELSEAFLSLFSNSNSILWVGGTILLLALFSLLCAYMIYNKQKNNITIRSKLMALIFLPILIIGSGVGTVYFIGNLAPEDRGPYLSWRDDPKTTMTISFERRIKGDYTLEYGYEGQMFEKEIDFERSDMRQEDGYYHYSVELKGLKPDKRYYYRIPEFMETVGNFKTAPNSTTADFKFLLYGDSREMNGIIANQHLSLVSQMLDSHDLLDFSFVINTGDLAGEHNDVKQWNLHFQAIKDLAKNVPYFVASGNHEWNDGDNWNYEAQPALEIQDFPEKNIVDANIYSLDEISYSFGFSNSFFIFLGYPHVGYEFDGEEKYLDWLEDQLAIGNESYDFTFVSLHRPPFDDREGEDSDDNPDIIERECPLFHNYSVEAVFCGHNHVLAHQKISWDKDPNERTVHYLISGGGGAPLREPQYGEWDDDYDMGFSGKTIFCKRAYNYYTIEVNAEKGEATFTGYELGGAELESFTIEAYNKI